MIFLLLDGYFHCGNCPSSGHMGCKTLEFVDGSQKRDVRSAQMHESLEDDGKAVAACGKGLVRSLA
jgi:hypothetical protein